jgi:hypothetical protein
VGYFLLLMGLLAIGYTLLLLRFPRIGAFFMLPYPRTRRERNWLVIPAIVFCAVLALNFLLPLRAQFPFPLLYLFYLFYSSTSPSLDMPMEDWLGLGNLAVLASAFLIGAVSSTIIGVQWSFEVDRDRWKR